MINALLALLDLKFLSFVKINVAKKQFSLVLFFFQQRQFEFEFL